MSNPGDIRQLYEESGNDPDAFLRAAYRAGEKAAPLVMVWRHGGDPMDDHQKIPTWAVSAIRDACVKAFRGEIKSWDEVFGKPIPKGKHQRGVKLRRRNSMFTFASCN